LIRLRGAVGRLGASTTRRHRAEENDEYSAACGGAGVCHAECGAFGFGVGTLKSTGTDDAGPSPGLIAMKSWPKAALIEERASESSPLSVADSSRSPNAGRTQDSQRRVSHATPSSRRRTSIMACHGQRVERCKVDKRLSANC